MEKVELGQSGVHVTPLAFGAWAIGGWMWGGADRKEAVKAIKRSIDLGITTIDTAAVYGFGKSEELVGEAIKGKRGQVQILTKCGINWIDNRGVFAFSSEDEQLGKIDIYRFSGKERIIEECEASLKRLGTDVIDLYQIHWPDPTTPADETMEAMERLIKEGKIRAAGVSNYSVEQMQVANEALNICSNQVPYSMLKREIEQDLIPYCLSNNKSILAYSPLQRGLLTGKIKPGYHFNPGDNRPDIHLFAPDNLNKIQDFLQKIKPIADDKGSTLAQLVLRWTLQRPGIDVVLAGARNPAQVEENARAAELVLTEDEMGNIDQHLEKLDLAL